MNFHEKDFQQLAQHLKAEWESVATYLGFSKSQIERFWRTNQRIEHVIFDILMTWQETQPQVINFRKVLGRVLEKAGRRDLVERFCHPEIPVGMFQKEKKKRKGYSKKFK